MTEKRERATYKLIFQDIDGVLNTAFIHHGIWKELAFRLADLAKATGAGIILSSQWRLHPESREEVKKTFLQVGLPMPLSCTPLIRGSSFRKKRWGEIAGWLRENTRNVFQGGGVEGIPSREEFLELEGAFTETDFLLPKRITVTHFVILDDIDLGLEKYGGKNHALLSKSHFVKTLPRTGLTENNVLEAMVLLGKSRDSISAMRCDFCRHARSASIHAPLYNKYFCSNECKHSFIHVEIPLIFMSEK